MSDFHPLEVVGHSSGWKFKLYNLARKGLKEWEWPGIKGCNCHFTKWQIHPLTPRWWYVFLPWWHDPVPRLQVILGVNLLGVHVDSRVMCVDGVTISVSLKSLPRRRHWWHFSRVRVNEVTISVSRCHVDVTDDTALGFVSMASLSQSH